jgi:hypothetical protein
LYEDKVEDENEVRTGGPVEESEEKEAKTQKVWLNY